MSIFEPLTVLIFQICAQDVAAPTLTGLIWILNVKTNYWS